jgi:ribosomal RNA-processing protein 9
MVEGRRGSPASEEEKKERLGGGFYPGEEPAEKPKMDKKGKRKEFVEGSLDTVCVLDEQHFLSGGDSG